MPRNGRSWMGHSTFIVSKRDHQFKIFTFLMAFGHQDGSPHPLPINSLLPTVPPTRLKSSAKMKVWEQHMEVLWTSARHQPEIRHIGRYIKSKTSGRKSFGKTTLDKGLSDQNGANKLSLPKSFIVRKFSGLMYGKTVLFCILNYFSVYLHLF